MKLEAIDVHTHISDPRARELQGAEAQRRFEERSRYFGRPPKCISLEDQAEEYRARNMKAILMNSTNVTVTGATPLPNEFVAETVASFPDVFLGMGAIDPWQGALAKREVRRIHEMGLAGVGELNPARQHFYPNDIRFYPIWEELETLGLRVLFHSGYAATGSGTPGGGGIKLKYTQPIHLDDVAADFPDLKIICAHPSWPWTAESLAIARHKPNFFVDISGWAPRYFPAELIQQMNSVIPHKVLFGTDFPLLPLDRWFREFDEIDLKPASRRKILLENAASLFAVDTGEAS